MKAFLSCCFPFLGLFCWSSVARGDLATDQIAISSGVSGIFDSEHNPTFILEYRFARNWVGLHPWGALSWATDGAVFAGGGALYSLSTPDDAWAVAVGFGPGYYERHQGADLGSHLEFCSFGEISRNLPWKHRVMLRLMHISNGGITERNPGNELVLFGYAIPLP